MSRILIINNYDSFVFNLARYVREEGGEPLVYENDALDIDGIRRLNPDGIIISPGPCGPQEAGVSLALVKSMSGALPILGVCLGHQVIGEAFGLKVAPSGFPIHGAASEVIHDGRGIFKGLQNPFMAARYHSLSVERPTTDHPLKLSAETNDGLVMGLTHNTHPTYGVQFHPESILTPEGRKLVGNFLRLCVKEGV